MSCACESKQEAAPRICGKEWPGVPTRASSEHVPACGFLLCALTRPGGHVAMSVGFTSGVHVRQENLGQVLSLCEARAPLGQSSKGLCHHDPPHGFSGGNATTVRPFVIALQETSAYGTPLLLLF